MIKRIRHKGLRHFYESGVVRGINVEQAGKIALILALLEAASRPAQLNLAGLRLHPLAGAREGVWSLRVNRNWRITFRFEDGNVTDVDYEDYH